MKTRLIAAAFLLVGIMLMSAITTGNVRAYNLEGCKWAQPLDITYTNSIVFSGDAAAFNASINDWNGTPADMLFQAPSSGQHVDVSASSYNSSSVSWDGLTTYACSGGYFSTTLTTDIQINHYYTQGYTSDETRSVTGHELGHALGLAHNSGPYLMDPYTSVRYGEYGVYTPQTDDINGAEALYGTV